MTEALDAWYDSLARCAGCVCVADEDAEDAPDPRTPEFTVLRREAATVAPTLSMLLEAADAGDIATVRAIVGAGALDLDAADDVDSYSALLTAAEAGHADVVGALLDAESMALLARLVSLPTVSQRAKLGGKAGQPLVKVVVVASALVAPPS